MEKHFCVSVFIQDPKTQNFLFIHHKKLDKWMPPGGHIEPDEDPEEAALRETFEETGLHVQILGERYPRACDFIQPLALQKDVISDNHIHMDFIYRARPLPNQVVRVNFDEANEAQWFSRQEIVQPNFNTLPDVKHWCQVIEGLSIQELSGTTYL